MASQCASCGSRASASDVGQFTRAGKGQVAGRAGGAAPGAHGSSGLARGGGRRGVGQGNSPRRAMGFCPGGRRPKALIGLSPRSVGVLGSGQGSGYSRIWGCVGGERRKRASKHDPGNGGLAEPRGAQNVQSREASKDRIQGDWPAGLCPVHVLTIRLL